MDEITTEQRTWLEKWNIDIEIHHFLIAITHPSYHTIDPAATDYERYEFLGDACLDLLVAEYLFNSDHQLSEGEMTRGRTKLVKNQHLAQIFDILTLKDIILTAVHYNPTTKDKANVVEALFGAVFLSKGYNACKTLWKKINENLEYSFSTSILSEDQIHPKIRNKKQELQNLYTKLELIPKDSISILQELCLKNKTNLPKYKLIQRRGPDHKPNYMYEVSVNPLPSILNENLSAIGRGNSKQNAKFAAAARLCELIYLPYVPT